MNDNDTIDALVERKVKQAVDQYLAKIAKPAQHTINFRTPIDCVSPRSMVDECGRNGNSWSEDEDKELAKELRQAITNIALKHMRSHYAIVCHIRDKKILF